MRVIVNKIAGDKINQNRKGYIYILEVLLAIGIMLSTVIFVFGGSPQTADVSSVLIAQNGIDALSYLDEKGYLREYVSENNETGLEDALGTLLPGTISFETDMCSDRCKSTNVTGTRTVITFDYFVSGYKNNFINKKVRIWLWERIG